MLGTLFWRYKVYADIRSGLWRGDVKQQWVANVFGVYIFRTFRIKANVGFPVTLKDDFE